MSYRILVFGDSNVWGAGNGWVERLISYCASKSDDVEVYNLGVCGDDTERLLARFENECEARGAAAIVICIGANDSQYIRTKDNPRVSLPQFEKNLNKIITIARKFTDKIAFIGPVILDEKKTMPIPNKPEKFYDMDNIRKYNNAIKSVCEKVNIPFLDMLNVLELDDFLDDGMHPNHAGHQKMFKLVRPFLEKNNIYELTK